MTNVPNESIGKKVVVILVIGLVVGGLILLINAIKGPKAHKGQGSAAVETRAN